MSVLESGFVKDAGCRYVAVVDPIPAFAIPVTLLGSLTARLDRLGPAREIAQIGAAIGHEFAHQLLTDVVQASIDKLKRGSQTARRRRIDFNPRRAAGCNVHFQARAGPGCSLCDAVAV